MNFLNFEQVARLRNLVAEHAGEDSAVAAEVMAYCGLRIGGALALRADDIDLGKRRIRVEQS